jgi:hypothetical protein
VVRKLREGIRYIHDQRTGMKFTIGKIGKIKPPNNVSVLQKVSGAERSELWNPWYYLNDRLPQVVRYCMFWSLGDFWEHEDTERELLKWFYTK